MLRFGMSKRNKLHFFHQNKKSKYKQTYAHNLIHGKQVATHAAMQLLTLHHALANRGRIFLHAIDHAGVVKNTARNCCVFFCQQAEIEKTHMTREYEYVCLTVQIQTILKSS
jgi:hypothetical protein